MNKERKIILALKLLLVLILNLASGFLINVMRFEPLLYPYYDFEDPMFAKTVNKDVLATFIFFLSPSTIFLTLLALVISLFFYWKDNRINKIVDALGRIFVATSVALFIISIIQLIQLWQLNLSFEGGCINSPRNCLEIHRSP